MQRPQKPLAIGAVLRRDIDVNPVRSRQGFTGIGARQSGAGGAPRHAGRVFQGRQHRQQGAPESTGALKLGRNSGRHALAVIVQQRKRRSAIDDIGAGAGDDVRPRHAIDQPLLGGDLNLVRQVRAQGAERDAPVTASGLRSARRAHRRRRL